MNNKLQEYAVKKMQIKQLEQDLVDMSVDILAFVDKQGGKIEKDYGIFSLIDFPHYKYSKMVTFLERKLKALKQKEIETRKAKKTITEVLRFTPLVQPLSIFGYKKQSLSV